MHLAMNTVCMPELEWNEAFAACKTAGFDRVELLAVAGWRHVDARTITAMDITLAARRVGVHVVGLHAGGIGGESDETLTETAAYVDRVLDLAGELACERVVLSAWPLPQGADASGKDRILHRLAAGLSNLAPKAEQLAVDLCLENHFHYQIETVEDYQRIFELLPTDSPRLRVTIDTGHYTASGVEAAAAVRTLAGRIGNVHIKDHRGHQSVPLGTGETDLPAVVRALREIGYAGDLTVELEVADRPNALRYAREAYPFLQRLVETAG